jgi:hypothetical protein
MCGDLEAGSASPFSAEVLDASEPDGITWAVDAVVELGGNFGTADSTSTLTATPVD